MDNWQTFTPCTDDHDALVRKTSLHLCVKDCIYLCHQPLYIVLNAQDDGRSNTNTWIMYYNPKQHTHTSFKTEWQNASQDLNSTYCLRWLMILYYAGVCIILSAPCMPLIGLCNLNNKKNKKEAGKEQFSKCKKTLKQTKKMNKKILKKKLMITMATITPQYQSCWVPCYLGNCNALTQQCLQGRCVLLPCVHQHLQLCEDVVCITSWVFHWGWCSGHEMNFARDRHRMATERLNANPEQRGKRHKNAKVKCR